MNVKPIKSAVLALGLVLLMGLLATPAGAFPEPSILVRDWEFKFTYETPRPISIRGLDGVVQWYWYMPYKVVNDTGLERLFIPEITIATDEGDIVRAGRNVPASLFARIKEQLGNRLLESPAQVVGRFLQGEDHAKESVAIWRQFDHSVTNVNIFVGGLSGETQEVPNPVTGEKILVSKTLMLDFEMPGKPQSPQFQTVLSRSKRWIMR